MLWYQIDFHTWTIWYVPSSTFHLQFYTLKLHKLNLSKQGANIICGVYDSSSLLHRLRPGDVLGGKAHIYPLNPLSILIVIPNQQSKFNTTNLFSHNQTHRTTLSPTQPTMRLLAPFFALAALLISTASSNPCYYIGTFGQLNRGCTQCREGYNTFELYMGSTCDVGTQCCTGWCCEG